MRKIIDFALAGANAAAASPLFRAMLPCTLVCTLIGGPPALADSKSSAEFTLTTCRAAMDNLAKLDAIARKNNWTAKNVENTTALNKFATFRSIWEVMQGEGRFRVVIWINHHEEKRPPDTTVCSVDFLGRNVKWEEFFNLISASVELMFMFESRFPHKRDEMYEVKSDGITKLVLRITSESDGTVTNAILKQEQR